MSMFSMSLNWKQAKKFPSICLSVCVPRSWTPFEGVANSSNPYRNNFCYIQGVIHTSTHRNIFFNAIFRQKILKKNVCMKIIYYVTKEESERCLPSVKCASMSEARGATLHENFDKNPLIKKKWKNNFEKKNIFFQIFQKKFWKKILTKKIYNKINQSRSYCSRGMWPCQRSREKKAFLCGEE